MSEAVQTYVTDVAISRDGRIVIASDNIGRLHQWDAVTGKLLKTVDYQEWLSSIAITPDGNTVVSTCGVHLKDKCGTVAWEISTLEQRATREGQADRIIMNASGTEVIVTSQDSAALLSLPSLEIRKSLPTAKGARLGRISDSGSEVATAQYSDGAITWRFTDLGSGGVTREFKLSRAEGYLDQLALGFGSRLLVKKTSESASADSEFVEILSPGPGGLEKVRLEKDFRPAAAVFSSDGSLVVTSRGNLIEIWDTRTGVLQKTLMGPQTIKEISPSADGKRLVALDAFGAEFVWQPFEAELIEIPKLNIGEAETADSRHDGTVRTSPAAGGLTAKAANDVRSSIPKGWRLPDDKFGPLSSLPADLLVIVRDDKREFGLWNAGKGAFKSRLKLPKDAGSPSLMASSEDGRWAILMTISSSSLFLWNLDKNATELRMSSIRGKPIVDAGFSPDSKFVAIVASNSTLRPEDAGEGGVVQIRRLSDQKVMREIRIKDGPGLESAEFSPNGKYLIVHTVQFERFGRYVYRTLDWTQVDQEEHIHWVERNETFFLKDERIFETEVSGNQLARFRLRTGWGAGSQKLVDQAFATRDSVPGLPPSAFDAKSERIALADGGEVVIIQTIDGALTRLEGEHLGNISAIKFLPNNDWLATGGSDGTVRLWDLRRKALAATFVASRDGQWLVFTPAGFFAGSDRPGQLMSVVQGQDVYSVEQFFGPLYRPDLVKEQLSGDLMGLHADAAKKLNLSAVLEKGAAPTLSSWTRTKLVIR